METEKRERRKLKLWVRVLLLIIIALGLFLPIIGIYKNQTTVEKGKRTKLYSATINKNSDYKVELFDNKFIDGDEMSSDQVYISDLVKNIDLDLYYTYNGTDNSTLKYTYDIKAKLFGENVNNTTGENELVWKKDYTLLEEQDKFITNKTGFNITENINIDYPKYKETVNNFKKQFGMNLTTRLEITMNIKYSGSYNMNRIDKTDKIVLDIPLGTQAFSINNNYNKKGNYTIYKDNPIVKKSGTLLIAICIIIMLITLVLFLLIYKAIFNVKPKSKYTKELEKILKSYGEVIVEVATPVKSKGYESIQVKNFEEMIDLEEELRIPIILYESIYSHTATFTITHNNTLYKYVLKA